MYLQLCRTKTYCIVQHTFLNKAVHFNFQSALQDPLRLLYVHCKSSSSNCFQIRNATYLYLNFVTLFLYGEFSPMVFIFYGDISPPKYVAILVSFSPVVFILFGAISPIVGEELTKHQCCPVSWLVHRLRHNKSHASLHMTNSQCMQCSHDISRAYIVYLNIQNSLRRFLSSSVKTSSQQFLSVCISSTCGLSTCNG